MDTQKIIREIIGFIVTCLLYLKKIEKELL